MSTVAAGIAALVVMAAFAAAAHAATASYYVDCAAGSDSNSGTSTTSAWRTLSAVNGRTFAAGNQINLKRGCSWDGGMVGRSSGTASAPIVYTAYGTGTAPTIRNSTGGTYAESVDISGDYNIIDGLLVRDARESGVMLRAGADHNVVRNTEVTAVGNGITANGQYNLLTHNQVHDLKMIVNTAGGDDDYGAVCFWIGGPNNEVSYNRGVNCRAPSSDYGYDGGFVEVWRQGDNTYVHHNFADNTSGFFEIGGSGSARNMKVAQNVLYNVHGGLCLHNGGTFAISFDNFRFEGNTAYATTGGYRFLDCVSGLTPSMVIMRDNIFMGNVTISSSGNFTHTNNLYSMTGGASVGYSLGSGEKQGNPLFVNAGAEDFHLQSGSPAIDAGVDAGYLTDFDDAARKAGAATDIGAYEFHSTSGTPTPTPPPPPPPSSTVTSVNDNSIGTALNQFSYSGSWLYATGAGKYLNDDHYAYAAGNAYTVRFSGTQARLYVSTAPWHGKAGVSLDGGPETTIDLYAASKSDQVLKYTSPVVAAGTHTLTVRVLGTKNTASTGTYVTADRVDVTS
ncbi:MAG TPA: choice-of-anchor Q domain-containing protein [Baekduia sp.]|nr:choice-of-anchor Q domain-containing protein [Baekduia sp.]